MEEPVLCKVKGLFDYHALKSDEVSFKANEILDIISIQSTAWWTARNQDGSVGLIPTNYVQVVGDDVSHVPFHENMPEVGNRASSNQKNQKDDGAVIPGNECDTVIAKFNFRRRYGDELTIQKGDRIDVIRKAKDGWWKGKIGKRIGWFPSNYVTKDWDNGYECGPDASVIHKVKCKFTFYADKPEELSCEVGDILDVIYKPEDDPEWWLVKNQDGLIGLVPINHVTVVIDTENEPANGNKSTSVNSAKEESSEKSKKGFFSSARHIFKKLGRKKSIYRVQPKSTVSSSSSSSVTNHVTQETKQSTVPPEILARGPLALRAYHNALSEGRTSVKRVPVMMIGQDRSGKTSLKKSLKGQVFNPNEDTTVGIDVDPSHFKVSTEVWKTGQKDQGSTVNAAFSYEHQAAQLIVDSLMTEKQRPEETTASVAAQSESIPFVSADSSPPRPKEGDLKPLPSKDSETTREPGEDVANSNE
ncbi:hypothetical protein ACROYT_G007942 [Oculina patagonica]